MSKLRDSFQEESGGSGYSHRTPFGIFREVCVQQREDVQVSVKQSVQQTD